MNLPAFKRSCRRSRGNAMIEFAIASSLLIPAFSGVFQFGYTLYQYNLLSSAVTNGARYGSNRTFRTASGGSDLTKVKLAIQNVVVYGSPSGGTIPQVKGLTAANVAVNFTTVSGLPRSVTVGVINFTVNGIFKSYTFNSSPVATFPYTGRYAPEESEP